VSTKGRSGVGGLLDSQQEQSLEREREAGRVNTMAAAFCIDCGLKSEDDEDGIVEHTAEARPLPEIHFVFE
jgi:hypothetical protein